jgi:hypothetical protein
MLRDRYILHFHLQIFHLSWYARPRVCCKTNVFQSNCLEAKNQCSSALSLCLMSGTVRRTVLDKILYTVSPSKVSNVLAFLHALHMPKHLHFDFAVHVRSICIWDWDTTSPYARQHDDSCGLCFYRKCNINFSLLVTCLVDRFYGQPANSVPSLRLP